MNDVGRIDLMAILADIDLWVCRAVHEGAEAQLGVELRVDFGLDLQSRQVGGGVRVGGAADTRQTNHHQAQHHHHVALVVEACITTIGETVGVRRVARKVDARTPERSRVRQGLEPVCGIVHIAGAVEQPLGVHAAFELQA
eukprot:Lithocolla_globosa_v1_NODE_3751_length_1591_cov_7.676432.p3 type:complete len:141 gc:universal NODE_3751_length_1591_cov_7.676432:12-434(+)